MLGLLRLDLGRPPVNEGGFRFLWVVDFPLFVALDDDRQPDAGAPPVHDAAPRRRATCSTAPTPSCWRSAAQAYDLVLNGWELGSGSVRIHRPDIQQRSSTCSASARRRRRRKFGFLLDAFRYGAPPHGGFAFGIDRLVALLAGEENIREVIAFPKTQSGTDPLTGAPTPIDAGAARPSSACGCCRPSRPDPPRHSTARRQGDP